MRMRAIAGRIRGWERVTRPVDPEFAAALRRRWDELPAIVKTPGQVLGRHAVGCEGTHGVFPKCNLACTPCYHSRDANRVRVRVRVRVDGGVTAAFVLANAAGTAAWTSAYPTFTELFPTHLRGAGVGFSVAVGRIGAIVGTLLLPSLATSVGATASYLLVVLFWLAGAVAMSVYARRGGPEAARRPLESLAPARSTASTAA